MNELWAYKTGRKKDWTLDGRAFDRLLRWLGGGGESEGEVYLRMWRRLVAYFDRKNCSSPEELADETLDRVARRIEEEGITRDETPERYCYIVARFVFLEYLRAAPKGLEQSDQAGPRQITRGAQSDAGAGGEGADKEVMLDCLERCVAKLDSQGREIITRYYVGKERVKIENRRALAGELGISMNALSVRACRIRAKLEVCVRRCAGGR